MARGRSGLDQPATAGWAASQEPLVVGFASLTILTAVRWTKGSQGSQRLIWWRRPVLSLVVIQVWHGLAFVRRARNTNRPEAFNAGEQEAGRREMIS